MTLAEELVAEVSVALGAPDAERGYDQLRAIWNACRGRLGMTEPIDGVSGHEIPLDAAGLGSGPILAGAQNRWSAPGEVRQVIVRRSEDVLVLSAAFGVTEGAPGSAGGWNHLALRWAAAATAGTDALLGQTRIYLTGSDAGRTGPDLLNDLLGRLPEPGVTPFASGDGRALCLPGTEVMLGDLGTADGDRFGTTRELVVAAPEPDDGRLGALTWSGGGLHRPALSVYLEHATRLRYEASLLRRWHEDHDVPPAPQHLPGPGDGRTPAERLTALRELDEALEEQVYGLRALRADLEQLRRTAEIASDNLRGALDGAVFAADTRTAEWIAAQVENDLDYLRINAERAAAAQDAVRSRLEREANRSSSPGTPSGAEVANRVFVVHGRDDPLRTRFYEFLQDLGVRPLEWEDLVAGLGSGPSPYIGQIVARAPALAQASIALMSPDDVVQLHSDLVRVNDGPHERGIGGQARPNVIFELGQALMAYPERTFIVEVGSLRPIGDLSGVNVIRFDGSRDAVDKVASRLRLVGCTVDEAGLKRWRDTNRFADLTTHGRGPGTHTF